MEFIFTFAFVFTWLIVRNYELKGEFAKIQNLVKPIFVYLAYGWAVASQIRSSSGICNPMVAIMVSIWERVSYDYIVNNTTKETYYSARHLGRYMWIYTLIPLAAGAVAGGISHFHMKSINGSAKLFTQV